MPGSVLSRTLGPLRTLPLARLLALAELALLAREHVIKLEPHERRRIRELVVRARGRRSNLSARERGELAMLLAKTEPSLFARSALKKFSPVRR